MEGMGRLMDLSFYNGKRVFLTGHTGFKGAWMSRALVSAGAIVTGYSLDPPTEPNLFVLSGVADKMMSIIGDIRDFTHLKQAFDKAKPEIVIHLAAQPIVRTSYEQPVYTYETNVMGTVNLLECVRTSQVPVKSVVNVTTDKVYLNNEWCWGLFFASTFSSKMQIKFLKVAWGISPLLHFLHRHCFRCRGGAVAGIQSLLVTGM